MRLSGRGTALIAALILFLSEYRLVKSGRYTCLADVD
jgi:hypothetical protein